MGNKSRCNFTDKVGLRDVEASGHFAALSQYLLHFGVDSLTHLRPTMSDQNRAVFIDVDQSCSLLHTQTQSAKTIKMTNRHER